MLYKNGPEIVYYAPSMSGTQSNIKKNSASVPNVATETRDFQMSGQNLVFFYVRSVSVLRGLT